MVPSCIPNVLCIKRSKSGIAFYKVHRRSLVSASIKSSTRILTDCVDFPPHFLWKQFVSSWWALVSSTATEKSYIYVWSVWNQCSSHPRSIEGWKAGPVDCDLTSKSENAAAGKSRVAIKGMIWHYTFLCSLMSDLHSYPYRPCLPTVQANGGSDSLVPIATWKM